jgi:hypothetical protein
MVPWRHLNEGYTGGKAESAGEPESKIRENPAFVQRSITFRETCNDSVVRVWEIGNRRLVRKFPNYILFP